MTIMLVRHAQTEWNNDERVQGWSDIALNDAGVIQAYNFCKKVNNDCWDLVISSDLQRAKQSASIVAQYLNLPLVFFSELRERNYGKLEGMKQEEISHHYQNLNFITDIPGGELYKNFYVRVIIAFSKIVKTYNNENIIIVTHGAVLNIICFNYLKLKGYKWKNMSHIVIQSANDNDWKILIENQET